MLTYDQLVSKFKTVPEGATIIIDDKEHIVVTNIHDDVLFLVNNKDDSYSFHIFYDEINPLTDNFTIVGN